MILKTIQKDYEYSDADTAVAVSLAKQAADTIRRSTFVLAQSLYAMHEESGGLPLYVFALQATHGDVIDSNGVVSTPLKVLWQRWLKEVFGYSTASRAYKLLGVARCLEAYEDDITALDTVPVDKLAWIGSPRNPDRLENPRVTEALQHLDLPESEWIEYRNEIWEVKPESTKRDSAPNTAESPIGHSLTGKWSSERFRRWVRGQPCILTLESSDRVDPHHIKTLGSGHKDFLNVVPLRNDLHRELHDKGIRTFLNDHGHQWDWLVLQAKNTLEAYLKEIGA
jgi:hypothetical protein